MSQTAQPYKFRLVQADGSTVEGGAETRDLCIEHVRQCLRNGGPNRVVEGYYLGKYAQNDRPKRIEP